METDYEDCERFYKELESYLKDYDEKVLSVKYTRATARKHRIVINAWCDYVTAYKSLTDFSKLSVSLVNSKFHSYYNWSGFNDDNLKNITLSNIIKQFLFFVYDEYGIANLKVLQKL